MNNILIKNATVIVPSANTMHKCDIYIQDGCICEIAEELEVQGAKIIDAQGLYVAPGLVDMHCHLREPGGNKKETIETGLAAAALGGFTSVACMPNTNPVADNAVVIDYVRNKARECGGISVFPIGAITKGLAGKELAAIGEIKFAGAVGISDDGNPVMNSLLMKRALQYAQGFDITVIAHCEDLTLSNDGYMNEGYTSTALGLRGISGSSESVMIARDVLLAEETGAPVHIAHVSTRAGVQIIRQAKQRGVNVTCETCPHYFSLTDQACMGYNTMAKVNPPLRSASDVQAVIEGLIDGTIDAIATDHAPHHPDDKNCEFARAANGISGFETALSVCLTYLVKSGLMDLPSVIYKMTVAPSRILGINKGVIAKNNEADIVIFAMGDDDKYTVDSSKFASKGKNTPFDGMELYGRVVHTIAKGRLIVQEGILI